MDIIKLMITEMNLEAETTRKMLALVPEDKMDWQPHQKSMTMQRLACHIAELNGWVSTTLNTSFLDLSVGDYKPSEVRTSEGLLAFFEEHLKSGLTSLEGASIDHLKEHWELRMGDQVMWSGTKVEMLRQCFCQIVHHRAQLGVNLRLLDIPIPGSYGPSADEMGL